MKAKTVPSKPVAAPADRPPRTPRVAAVRHIRPDRPQRVWSLLLPPSFEHK